MSKSRRTSQQTALIENVRYLLPLKSNIKNGRDHNKVKKTVVLLFAILFIFMLVDGLGMWTNN